MTRGQVHRMDRAGLAHQGPSTPGKGPPSARPGAAFPHLPAPPAPFLGLGFTYYSHGKWLPSQRWHLARYLNYRVLKASRLSPHNLCTGELVSNAQADHHSDSFMADSKMGPGRPGRVRRGQQQPRKVCGASGWNVSPCPPVRSPLACWSFSCPPQGWGSDWCQRLLACSYGR